ncbi:5-oxoprolinase subunit PxpA [Muriicola marianensis]|uniref:LamB/YcsF family protein n=1 Tax=Muriicola marianensis TaxID=1324801 RepID=A0ABQ1QRI0_9FLAO|nr:5-oxoprolinase subunit PxpA [Muriicola marianensis]GGD39851.1 LamB/YcsF family protein [Muriicola marianensis]
MKRWQIDINCDVGEGVGNEARLFPYISSCNLACGGHAGDEPTMREVISLAKKHHVRVGAHPSYPDRENFGRKSTQMESEAFRNTIQSQVKLLHGILKEEGIEMSHIKAHGALYNDLAKNRELSEQYLEALADYRNGISLYAPYGSAISDAARQMGFNIILEAFGDRNYEDDLSLVSRRSPQALITEPEAVLRHLLSMIVNSEVKTINGIFRHIEAQTFCIHGDTATAFEILAYLSVEFPKHHIHLRK